MFGIVTKMKIGWTAIETLNIFKLGIIVEERTQIPTFLLIKKGWNSHRYRFCGFRWILSCTCSALMIYHGYNAQNEWLYFNGGFHLIGFLKLALSCFRESERERENERKRYVVMSLTEMKPKRGNEVLDTDHRCRSSNRRPIVSKPIVSTRSLHKSSLYFQI